MPGKSSTRIHGRKLNENEFAQDTTIMRGGREISLDMSFSELTQFPTFETLHDEARDVTWDFVSKLIWSFSSYDICDLNMPVAVSKST